MMRLIDLRMTNFMTAIDLFCEMNHLTPETRNKSFLSVNCIRQSKCVDFLVENSVFRQSKYSPASLAIGELSDGVLSFSAYQYTEHGMESQLFNPETLETVKGHDCRKLSDVYSYLASMTMVDAANTRLYIYETHKAHSPLMFHDKDKLIFGVNTFYTIARQSD